MTIRFQAVFLFFSRLCFWDMFQKSDLMDAHWRCPSFWEAQKPNQDFRVQTMLNPSKSKSTIWNEERKFTSLSLKAIMVWKLLSFCVLSGLFSDFFGLVSGSVFFYGPKNPKRPLGFLVWQDISSRIPESQRISRKSQATTDVCGTG